MSNKDTFHDITGDENILTQGKFRLIIGKHSCIADVSISRENLTYRSVNGAKLKAESISFSDVVGCLSIGGGVSQRSDGTTGGSGDGAPSRKQKTNSRLKLNEKSACLQVFAYKYNKKPTDGGVRRRLQLNLVTEEFQTREENTALVEKWRLIILSLLRGVEFSDVNDLRETSLPPPPHYLVCVNPFSGNGKAVQIFKNQAKPIFVEAGITFRLIITERKGHGTELAMNLDLKEYNGVIIVSGDGLLYEFINGFGERPDREEAFKMPFGMLPGGSGNALCSSALSLRGDNLKNMACHAAVAIIKGKSHPKDLVRIQTQNETSLSFISVAWGLIADIDIESERFRFLGATRFLVGTVQRLMFFRKTPGRLSFLPIKDESKYQHLFEAKDKKKNDLNGITTQESQRIQTNIGDEVVAAAAAQDSRNESANQNANASSSMEGAANATAELQTDDLAMPPLTDAVPPNWTVIEGDFVCVLVSYLSHLSNDFVCFPGRPMDEGVIMVQYMDGTTTRGKVLDSFDKFKTGGHLQDSGNIFHSRIVQAFRLEPLTKDGILTADGERVNFGPIQGMVTSSKCHCIL